MIHPTRASFTTSTTAAVMDTFHAGAHNFLERLLSTAQLGVSSHPLIGPKSTNHTLIQKQVASGPVAMASTVF